MRIEQEQLTAEFVQKIIDLSSILIKIAKALNEAAGYALGVARHALEAG
jgi:hypothetical protein